MGTPCGITRHFAFLTLFVSASASLCRAQQQPMPDLPEPNLTTEVKDSKTPKPPQPQEITLSSLQAMLNDPSTAESVIPKYLADNQSAAPDLSMEDKQLLLRAALRHSSEKVRRQAAVELQRRGWLEDIVAETLLKLLDEPKPENVAIVLQGLEPIRLKDPPDNYVRVLLDALQGNQGDTRTWAAAEAQLKHVGAGAVPTMLGIVLDESASSELRVLAAKYLGEFATAHSPEIRNGRTDRQSSNIESDVPDDDRFARYRGRDSSGAISESLREQRADSFSEVQASVPAVSRDLVPSLRLPQTPSVTPPTVARPAAADGADIPLVRRTPDDRPMRVRVYYGTNRAVVSPRPENAYQIWVCLISGLCVGGIIVVELFREARRILLIGVSVFAAVVLLWQGFSQYSMFIELTRGVVFGNGRDPDGSQIHHGWCDVSLPADRISGTLPMAAPGFENADEHVILLETRELERNLFLEELRNRMAMITVGSKDCFVFVHGYQVDFREAACRTAQLHLDLDFPGVPLFFSWPSRAALGGYVVDANEVRNSAGLVRKFLQDVANESGADRVHVIAHSKGGEIVSWAINELDPGQRLFHQVILAAPDIDADVFRREIVPKLSKVALRATLYCSGKDRALRMSKAVNGYRRAGDSDGEPFVAPLLDTIDVSSIDTSMIGHSYYGDCAPVISDIAKLLTNNAPPETRGLLPVQNHKGDDYWLLSRPTNNTENPHAP